MCTSVCVNVFVFAWALPCVGVWDVFNSLQRSQTTVVFNAHGSVLPWWLGTAVDIDSWNGMFMLKIFIQCTCVSGVCGIPSFCHRLCWALGSVHTSDCFYDSLSLWTFPEICFWTENCLCCETEIKWPSFTESTCANVNLDPDLNMATVECASWCVCVFAHTPFAFSQFSRTSLIQQKWKSFLHRVQRR